MLVQNHNHKMSEMSKMNKKTMNCGIKSLFKYFKKHTEWLSTFSSIGFLLKKYDSRWILLNILNFSRNIILCQFLCYSHFFWAVYAYEKMVVPSMPCNIIKKLWVQFMLAQIEKLYEFRWMNFLLWKSWICRQGWENIKYKINKISKFLEI